MFSRKGSKLKEDEKIEKAIRNLLKLPENRRCINCDSLGPQYVCTTFSTFVCMNCSGIHREFTHRVKSISMAKFTAEEVSALQAGGNERAKQIYFKGWSPSQRNDCPDGSNDYRLRDFIKSVYVDRKYSGEGDVKISRLRMPDTENSSEILGSRSLHSEGGKQNTGHVRHHSRSRGLPKSPISFEIVDDRFRDDGGIKRYDSRNSLNKEARGYSKSLDLSNREDSLSSPVGRPVRELLGDKVLRLRIGNVVKAEEKKDVGPDPPKKQSSTPPHKNAEERKSEQPESLIDIIPAAENNKHIPESADGNSNEHPASQKANAGPAANSLEALLFGVSVPSVVSGVDNSELCNKGSPSSAITPSNVLAQSSTTAGSPGPMLLDAADNFNTKGSGAPSVTADNQPWMTSISSDFEEQSGASMQQPVQDISHPAQGQSPGVGTEPHPEETKSSQRKELPEDLFTGGISFASTQVQLQPQGVGYGMQYYPYPMTMGAYTYAAKPNNPFDLNYDTAPVQAPQFPSMAFMQGALPHVSAPSMGVMASQSPSCAAAASSPRSPSFAPTLSPGAYIAQQTHMNTLMSPRQEMMDGARREGNGVHQASNAYSYSNPASYSSRGNPFG